MAAPRQCLLRATMPPNIIIYILQTVPTAGRHGSTEAMPVTCHQASQYYHIHITNGTYCMWTLQLALMKFP